MKSSLIKKELARGPANSEKHTYLIANLISSALTVFLPAWRA